MLTAICLSVLLCILVYFLLYKRDKTGKQLNGPTGYPLIGNILDADPGTFHLKLYEWSRTFGEIFAVRILNKTIFVLNSSPVIRDALLTKPHDVIFASRPPSFIGFDLMYGYSDVAFAPYSEKLMRTRKFVHKLLKMYGEGHGRLENVLHQELEVLVRDIKRLDGAAIDLGNATEVLIHHAIGILVI
jgi:hypothetical protein